MKDNDIDNLLREKAKQIDDNKYSFKINVDEIKRKADSKRRGKIIKISFTSALCACLLLGALFFISRNSKPADNNVIIQGNDDVENNDNEEVFKSNKVIDTIVYNTFYNDPEDLLWIIAIVNVKDVSQIGIKDGLPKTKVKSEITEILYQDPHINNYLNNEIEFDIYSCVFDLAHLPDEIKYDSNNNHDGEYIRVISNENMIDNPIPEENKYYIVSLSEINGNNYITNNAKYSFYEYDPDTKKVKIGDQWQDIDFNYIVW